VWVKYIKKSIAEVAPRFTMNRMLVDYSEKYYTKLYERSRKMKQDDYALARDLASWKKIMMKLWSQIRVVSFSHPDITHSPVALGKSYEATLEMDLGNLSPDHVGVELVIRDYEHQANGNHCTYTQEFELLRTENTRVSYRTEVTPVRAGSFDYGIRVFARHPELPHRQDFPLVRWV
jgi:phosphorylase/glycogen(starch) synthase